MKYIHIVQFHLMSGGGVGSVITDVCEAMAKKSDEVYAISLFQREGVDFEKELEWARQTGVHSVLLQKNEKDSVCRVLRNLRREIKALAKDDECILYLHLKWGVLAGILASLGLKNVKRVEVYHSGYMRYKLQAFLSKPFIDRYIAVSKEAKKQLVEWFHVREEKIEVVYNGVDVEKIRDEARKAVPVSAGFAFAAVGRLSFEKGFKTPIQAYAELRREGKLSGTSYTMVGTGDQMDECVMQADGFVDFTGLIPRAEVYPRIAGSDVLVLPSLWEGNSILMLEVLALGKPMILTDIPSFREVLGFNALEENEVCRAEWFGVVFRKENVESCKEALERAFSIRESFPEMSKRIAAVGDGFSTGKQAAGYMGIIEKEA